MPTTTTERTTTTHRLEGADLDALLAQVRDEHGPDAVIVEANKLRTGGVGGFFAKEAFEVVVNVPAEADRAEPLDLDAPAPAATGLDALIEAASAADAGPCIDTPTPAPSAPRMSTDGAGFAGVLDRMVRDAGVELGLEAPRPVGPSATAPAATPAEPASEFEPLHAHRVERPTERAAVGAAQPGTTIHVAPARMPAPEPARPALDQRWLARVGVPAGLAAQLAAPRTEPVVFELLRLMEHIPAAPALPTEQGSVIAVAGPRTEALRTAQLLADELDVNPEEILVAAESFRGGSIPQERRLGSLDAVMEQRRSWRRRRTPTLVAVDAGIGRLRGSWALHVVDALEPTMVWGVVEASRKPEDICHWAERLGGLDALAVTDVHATVSPATVLGAGVPVGLLDGHAATASRWTALLAEQLEVAA